MVQQHELLKVRVCAGKLAAGAWLLLGSPGCIGAELDDVAEISISTHVEDWRDEVIYQLLTDRFANGDSANDYRKDASALAHYQGGDYRGIVDKLDYLEGLGVTTIWISPIVKNVDADAGFDAYHGYWGVALDDLNPHFGGLADLRALVKAVHARKMKVILDIVTNHMGQVFYYDINNNGQPDEWLSGSGERMGGGSGSQLHAALARTTEYDPDYDPKGVQAFTSLGLSGPAQVRFFDMPEIFRVPPSPAIFSQPEVYNRRGRVTSWDSREQTIYGDFPGGLKDLDTTIPQVREALTQVYVDWVLKADFDGLRIDTLKHVETEFWQEFAPEVRRRLALRGKRNFLLFGEAFDDSDELVGSFTGERQLDSVFYFPQKFQVFDSVFLRGGATKNIERLFEQRALHYSDVPQEGGVNVPPRQLLVNFIDNHDVPRFMFERGDPSALRAALAYLFTEDGIPCLYYGTEQEYWGGNDPANREPLWWSGYATNGETFQWISKLARTRKTYPALTRGSFELTWTTEHTAGESDAGIVAFERKTAEGDYALVVINAQGKHTSRSVDAEAGTVMAVTAEPGSTLIDALGGGSAPVAQDGTLAVELPPHGTAIFVPEGAYVP